MLCKKTKTKKDNQTNLGQPTFHVNTLTKMLVVLRDSTSVQNELTSVYRFCCYFVFSTFVSKHHLALKR